MFTVEDLAWLIGVLEDWLLHASYDTSADLATFVGNGAFSRPADQHARVLWSNASVQGGCGWCR